jgi:uncharacterized protein
MNINNLAAIDVHTHAEVSCRQPADAFWHPYEAAASDYFKVGKRPTISETIAYYRERKIGLIMFTVEVSSKSARDASRTTKLRRPPPPMRTS